MIGTLTATLPLSYRQRLAQLLIEKPFEMITSLETEITFHNKANLRVQAQIFVGRTLISTCVTDPDEVGILTATSARYDIFLKNGATGWELARKLNSEAKVLTLSQQNGRYIIT